VLLPYALGDRIAHLALILNDSLRGLGLGEMAMGWAVVMGALAFMPSLLSGIQFPLLVSLLGRGNAGVGRQLGRAYLWNTFGSISGSLLGGFILVPLGAEGMLAAGGPADRHHVRGFAVASASWQAQQAATMVSA
jgi:spermidine synthase